MGYPQDTPYSYSPQAIGTPSASPSDYSSLPENGPAEPARGSILQAWLMIGIHPARRRIASWAQGLSNNWLTPTLMAIGVLAAISALVGGGVYFATNSEVARGGGQAFGATTLVPYSIGRLIAAIFESVITSLLAPLGAAAGLAIFLNRSYGDFSQRFMRILKPVALAVVSVTAVGILFNGLTTGISTKILPQVAQLSQYSGKSDQASVNAVLQILQNILPMILLSVGLGGIFLAYATVQYVQAGAIGTNLNRWAVFGILLLTLIVWGIVSALINIPFGLIG